MKWSIYNRIYPIDTYNSALYNYANDKAIFVVNDLVELLSEGNPDYIKSIHSNLYDSLVESHMLVNDDYDEVKAIKGQLSRRLSSSKTLRITINPTMDCNLKCWYCYECKEAKTQISEQVSSAVLQFIEKNVYSGTECLFLSYFGGEPLLKASRLAIPITKKIKEICETKGCLLNLHFTTNGTLLIPFIADSILDIGVPTSFQIAFDGDRYYHNMAKNISGLGTYDTLLNNIKYVLSLKMKVNIRCNYTATNISSFKNLVKDLAAIGILNN